MQIFAQVAANKSEFIELAQLYFRRAQCLFPISSNAGLH